MIERRHCLQIELRFSRFRRDSFRGIFFALAIDDTVAIDATHFEARDQAPSKKEKDTTPPKKRGRKSKEER